MSLFLEPMEEEEEEFRFLMRPRKDKEKMDDTDKMKGNLKNLQAIIQNYKMLLPLDTTTAPPKAPLALTKSSSASSTQPAPVSAPLQYSSLSAIEAPGASDSLLRLSSLSSTGTLTTLISPSVN